MEQVAREQAQKEERRIIDDFTATGKITPRDIMEAVKAMKAAETMNQKPQQALVIANAATAATIRKQFSREEVEIIITPCAEDYTAYVVTNEDLKQQLLECIKQRGY